MSFIIDPLGDNIILRSPDFNNIIRIDANDIRRFTRGGTLKTYVSADWAAFITHVYRFSVIRNTTAPNDLINRLKTFLETNAGLEINVTDHLNNNMDGFIVTPVNEIIAERPDCSYGVSFDFMETPT